MILDEDDAFVDDAFFDDFAEEEVGFVEDDAFLNEDIGFVEEVDFEEDGFVEEEEESFTEEDDFFVEDDGFTETARSTRVKSLACLGGGTIIRVSASFGASQRSKDGDFTNGSFSSLEETQ